MFYKNKIKYSKSCCFLISPIRMSAIAESWIFFKNNGKLSVLLNYASTILCKKPNVKNLQNHTFRVSRGINFSYLLNIALDYGGCPLIPFKMCGLYYNIQFKPYPKTKVELFVTKNILLNVKGLLDPTLKHIHKFRLR